MSAQQDTQQPSQPHSQSGASVAKAYLYIVATIGNISDITDRAIDTLKR